MPDVLEFSPNRMRVMMEGGARSPLAMLARKRRVNELGTAEIASLTLDGDAELQRLRYDSGAERIEIGSVLSEPEREWLFCEITKLV